MLAVSRIECVGEVWGGRCVWVLGWGGGGGRDRGVVHVCVCIFCSKLSTSPRETLAALG